MAVLAFATAGCNKIEIAYDAFDDEFSLIETKAGADDGFGFYEAELIAGQHLNVGAVTIWNDFDNVNVKFATTDGWQMGETHLYIGPKEFFIDPDNGFLNSQGTPRPGHFPYGDSFDPMVTEWVFSLPLIDLYAMYYGKELAQEYLDAGQEICPVVCAHAVVWKEGMDPNEHETAFSFGTEFDSNRWGWYTEGYCVKFPPEPPTPPTYEFDEETAWAFESLAHSYNTGKKGNWARFVQYDGEAVTFNLEAGKGNITEMTVTLTPTEDGNVKMVFANIFVLRLASASASAFASSS